MINRPTSLGQKLALVAAMAVVPVTAALAIQSLIGRPDGSRAQGLGTTTAVTLVSIFLTWWVAVVGIARPVRRNLNGLPGPSKGDAMGEIERAVEFLKAELAAREEEIATAKKARVAAEEALLNSMDVLKNMVSTLPVGVVAIGRDGRIKLWNHAAETILGYGADEMIGNSTPTDIFSLSAVAGGGAADVFLRVVTGQSVKGEEVCCRRKDGSKISISFSGAPMMDEDERLRGAICVFEDVSQRKMMTDQLYQAQKMEAVGQLTGGLAHDFNNILGIAIGNLDLLSTEIGDRPKANEMVETALNALLRGAELTRALLAYSRRQPLQPAIVDVANLLTGVGKMLSRTLGEHVSLALHVPSRLWPVMADAAQLEAAITNLAINARDAMPSGGKLTVECRNVELDEDYAGRTTEVLPGEYLVIEVSDTGCGMSPEVLARVFEPFFTTKGVGQGTGLGLSMVYGFIKQSGGHIRIYSEVGHGTTVRLYLPRAVQKIVGATQTPSRGPLPGGDETVLVVEDNSSVRTMVENQLRTLGYTVVTAEHGPAALSIIESSADIDLLFTDVVMPEGMTGFQLAEAARIRRPGLKVLVTSGFPGTTFHPGTTGGGTMDFLSKPFRRQDLARAVRGVLDGGVK